MTKDSVDGASHTSSMERRETKPSFLWVERPSFYGRVYFMASVPEGCAFSEALGLPLECCEDRYCRRQRYPLKKPRGLITHTWLMSALQAHDQ
jgi:hypothetical protein